MEIFYLHIKEYNQYKNADINFGGEFRFFYNANKQELRIEKNQHYIKDFFKSTVNKGHLPQALVNKVSCIIGENGAGKSTLLNFIKFNLIRGVSRIEYPIILGLKTLDEKKIVYYFADETPIKKNNCEDYGFDLKPLNFTREFLDKKNKTYVSKFGPDIPAELRNTDFIYLSNVFDAVNEIKLSGLYNLSTNYLIKNDKKSLVENKITNNYANEVDTHRVEDVIRQVNFLYNYKDSEKYIKFELPETLSFTPKQERDFVNNNNAKSFIDNSSLKRENPNLPFIEKLIKKAQETIANSKDERENTLITFYTNCFVNFLIEVHQNYDAASDVAKYDFSFQNIFKQVKFTKDFTKDLFEILNKLKLETNSIPQSIDETFRQWILSIENYYKLLNEVIAVDTLKYAFSNKGNVFTLNVNNNSENITKLLLAYTNTFQLTPHLDFKWRNLSSGQLALLNLYSRLYTRVDTQVRAENVKLKKNIVLLIDEADVYLHPHWSQTIVQSIIDFVSDIYTSADKKVNREIQIIFTSNSPFIAADIPSSNVVFLKKELQLFKNPSTKTDELKWVIKTINSLEDKKETFGANIHTLLLDSFFLPFGSLSEFAKNKIENVIEKLNSPKPFKNSEEKENLRKTIGIIGEPVIKRKLLQMFNDRFNVDIDDRIKKIEDELLILKKNRRSDTN